MILSYKNIAPFLSAGQNKVSRWLSYIGLGVGVLLLLSAVQMYYNINYLIRDKNTRKNGADFISITKIITNENMGKDNRFTDAEINGLKAQPFIEGAAPLKANAFKVTAGAGDMIPFSTDIFVEAINTNFIDTVPESFQWKEGDAIVPVIFSTDFLEMYNVFAPSWDLPQLSEKTATTLPVFLRCTGHKGERQFRAKIVAFSDRINSVLVPESFLEKQNRELGEQENAKASRVFIKTRDANNPDLLSYLTQKEFHVNKDKTKFGRVKGVLQSIVSGLAGFGVLVILLALVLFSFYLQLMIAKSKDNLQLLLTLGYSPKWLSKTVAKKWIPVYIIIIISALLLTQLLHWGFQHFVMPAREELSFFINWTVIVIAVLLLVLSAALNYRLVQKSLDKL
jgi:ABC-type antimicrobial peptide transport system permease subunit